MHAQATAEHDELSALTGGCALCARGERDVLIADLWELRGLVQHGAKRRALTTKVLAAHGVDVPVEEVERHFGWHRALRVQPWISSHRAHRIVERVYDGLRERDWAMLDLLSHINRMTTEQVAQVFYAHLGTRTAARAAANRDLNGLAFSHLVYRADKRGARRSSYNTVWSLGFVGALVLERAGLTDGLAPHVRERKQVADQQLAHDIALADALLALWRTQRDADAQPLIAGVPGRVRVPLSYIETDRRYTELRTVVAAHTYRGQMQSRYEGYVRPDALACLTVELPEGASAPLGGSAKTLHSTLVPMLVEWDTGTVDLDRVARQLTDYLHLHATGSLAERFPQLADVPALDLGQGRELAYRVPLVMVTRSRSLTDTGQSKHRALAVWRAARERYAAMTLPAAYQGLRPPMLIVADRDLAEHGLAAPALSLWQREETDRTTLLAALLNSAAPLFVSGALAPSDGLTARPEAARHKLAAYLPHMSGWREDVEDKEDDDER